MLRFVLPPVQTTAALPRATRREHTPSIDCTDYGQSAKTVTPTVSLLWECTRVRWKMNQWIILNETELMRTTVLLLNYLKDTWLHNHLNTVLYCMLLLLCAVWKVAEGRWSLYTRRFDLHFQSISVTQEGVEDTPSVIKRQTNHHVRQPPNTLWVKSLPSEVPQ